MFDPRRLIREVQLRPNLWDQRDKNYPTRSMRKRAWGQIAEILYADWPTFTIENKKEILDELQSRWKHIREYYLKEKRRNSHINNNPAFKPKLPLYFDMLTFLDSPTKNPRVDIEKPTDVNNQTDFSDFDVESFFLPSSQTTNQAENCDDIMTALQNSINSQPSKESVEDEADKNFLLSLLPDIKSMTAKEKFDFKFEILSAIKRIKYDPTPPSTVDGSQFCPEPISSTQYPIDTNLGFSLP